MSSPDMSKTIVEFLHLLAAEIENNQALGRRLARPFQEYLEQQMELKPGPVRKKSAPVTIIPDNFDPFLIYHDQGSVGLYAALQNFDAAQCKEVLRRFALDPSRSYNRWRKQERLANFIVERIKAMSDKGKVFMD